jgi:ABC-2 type transport system permease protein/capsular polysaccharide transport system permease protein
MRNSEAGASTGGLLNDGPWKIQRRVIGALLLREMLTRYGRNNIGFLWLFLEPMLFTLVVVLIRSRLRDFYEGSIPMIAFAITGWPSLMLWRNMPNRLMGALKSNRALLHHRQVTIMDIYLSRLLLEQMATTTSVILVGLILYSAGWLTPPEDYLQVVAGWLLLGWFGAGLALTVGSLSERSQLVENLWRPSIYVFMPLSGIAFVIDALPPAWQPYAMWIPMLNALEFMRDGWFGSTFHAHYDIGYVVTVNMCLTLVGLSLARQVGLDEISE